LACRRVSLGRLRHGELVLHRDAEAPFFGESGGSWEAVPPVGLAA